MKHPGEGKLLGLLTVGGTTIFTLLPNSHSVMILWPGVFLWQILLFLPLIWLSWQLWHKPLNDFQLGGGLDWIMGLVLLAVLISTIPSEFPHQAAWYGLTAVSGVAAVYALYSILSLPKQWEKLLQFHGLIAIVFSLESLGLWLSQTYLPEWNRLREIKLKEGIILNFDFKNLDLQNWHPLGHQNYVAGYLVLTLPVLVGLSVLAKGRQRWFWAMGVLVGLIDLYTTSSRGGWLAIVFVISGVFLWVSRSYPWRLRLSFGAGISTLFLGIIFSNDRLRSFFFAVLQGDFGQGQLTYRWITNAIGWNMGISHPWTGLGLGTVPIVYQHYRPLWAGQEAELQYQLHSTPAQLWAELGILGMAIPLLLIGLIYYRLYGWYQEHQAVFSQKDSIIVGSIMAGLMSYGFMSLTDYQLDNIAISSTLILYLAVLWRIIFTSSIPYQANSLSFLGAFHEKRKNLTVDDGFETLPSRFKLIAFFSNPKISSPKILSLGTIGFGISLGLWLIPIHRAWSIAQDGFNALGANQIDRFVEQVSVASRLHSWESYYPYQLAWNLGELSSKSPDATENKRWRTEAIHWFEVGNTISPYQEFGYSNLGWLSLQDSNPSKAIESFQRSAELVPAKRGVFLGLGLSYLFNDQIPLAIESFSRELLRHPQTIASPIWYNPPLEQIRPQVFDRLEQNCTQLISELISKTLTTSKQGAESSELPQGKLRPREDLLTYAHEVRGALRWWQGDLEGAKEDWTTSQNALGLAIVAFNQNPDLSIDNLANYVPNYLFTKGADQWQNDRVHELESSLGNSSRSSGQFLLFAWYDQSDRFQLWVDQAWRISIEKGLTLTALFPSKDDLLQDLIQAKEQSMPFDTWLKDLKHYQAVRQERLGFGVLNRHLGGAVPVDYGYTLENLLINQFFPNLFPQRSFFPRLDLYLERLNKAHSQLNTIAS